MKTKRIISLLFAACMCIMLLSTTAFAAGAPHLTTGGTPTFSADEGYTETDVPEQYVTVYVNDSGLDAANLTATLNDTTHFTIRPKTGEESDWNTGTTGTLVRNAEVPAGSNVRFAVQPQAGIEAGTYNTTIEITADQVDPPLSVDVRFTVSRQSVSVSISKGVTQGGSLIPPAKTFEFELDFVEEGLTAGALTITGNTVDTNGVGGGSTALTITGAADKMNQLKSGFFIREKNDGAEGWTYSNKTYYVVYDTTNNAWVGGEGSEIPSPLPNDMPNGFDFTNTYTMNGSNKNSSRSDNDDEYYIIDSWADEGGSISPEGRVVVSEGADKKFTIKANDGYEIQKVVVDGKDKGALRSYTFENVTRDHTIKAYFVKTGVPVEAKDNPNTGAAMPSSSRGMGLMVAMGVLALAVFTVKKE